MELSESSRIYVERLPKTPVCNAFLRRLMTTICCKSKPYKNKKNDAKSIPAAHPAKELLSMWDTLPLLDDEDTTLILVDGQIIFVPKNARPQI